MHWSWRGRDKRRWYSPGSISTTKCSVCQKSAGFYPLNCESWTSIAAFFCHICPGCANPDGSRGVMTRPAQPPWTVSVTTTRNSKNLKALIPALVAVEQRYSLKTLSAVTGFTASRRESMMNSVDHPT
ncbi:hypothetical protein VTK26DRAFT_6703 [Humicola hyalothermophila]